MSAPVAARGLGTTRCSVSVTHERVIRRKRLAAAPIRTCWRANEKGRGAATPPHNQHLAQPRRPAGLFFLEPIPALGIVPLRKTPKSFPHCGPCTLGPASAGPFLSKHLGTISPPSLAERSRMLHRQRRSQP